MNAPLDSSLTLTPLVSSESNDPISNASAALTSPLGGMSGGLTCSGV